MHSERKKRVAPKRYTVAQKIEFHSVPEPNSGCILWLAATDRHGYGFFWNSGKQRRAHRVAYEEARGPIPEGMVLDHLCRTPSCVNPFHLEAVTVRENTVRGVGLTAVNARKEKCVHGHALSGDNLTTDHRGNRACRECQRRSGREFHRAHPRKRDFAAEYARRTALDRARALQQGRA